MISNLFNISQENN